MRQLNLCTSGKLAIACLALALAAECQFRGVRCGEIQATSGEALKYLQQTNLTGSIYPQGGQGQQPLFQFKRLASLTGSTLNVKREFTYPDGKSAARERVVYEGDKLVLYELEELQIGAKGSAKIGRSSGNQARGSIDFDSAQSPGASSHAKVLSEPLQENTLIN